MPQTADSDAWKRLVLQAMTPPAWLVDDGPFRDIVLSTRARIMRNLRGKRFPHQAPPDELKEIADKVTQAFNDPSRETLRNATPAERDYLVACRLVSPDFDWKAVGRAVVLDKSRITSVMVNEEDHVRFQALTPGWSLSHALKESEKLLAQLQSKLEFAYTDRYGFLAASPSNCGSGLRHSALFHLIGLAHTARLSTVIKALTSQGLVVRGIFGERSRAVGALAQVSTTSATVPAFVGACEYLIQEERKARQGVPAETVQKKGDEALDFAERSQTLTLGDALRILAWLRWSGQLLKPREIDALIPEIALLESLGEPRAGRSRAALVRRIAGL